MVPPSSVGCLKIEIESVGWHTNKIEIDKREYKIQAKIQKYKHTNTLVITVNAGKLNVKLLLNSRVGNDFLQVASGAMDAVLLYTADNNVNNYYNFIISN